MSDRDPPILGGFGGRSPQGDTGARGPLPDLVIAALVLTLTAALLVVVHWDGSDLSLALKDPATLTGQPFYLGAVSNAGAGLLIVAATATAMAASLGARPRRLFAWVAALSALLAADDLFLLHEGPIRGVLPWFELFMFALYGGAAAAIVWAQRRLLFRPRQMPLLLGLAGLALSVALDSVLEGAPLPDATEDLAKFAGYVFWSIYWTRLALDALRAPVR